MKFKPLPAAEYLCECLTLNQADGSLTWRRRPLGHFATKNAWSTWNSRWAGKPAFNRENHNGYFAGCLDWKQYLTHRIIWKMVYGEDPIEIDHIDGNPKNNKIDNLRSVGRFEQTRNAKVRSDNTSGHAGIHWDRSRQKWTVSISDRYAGRFENLDEAVAFRRRAERDHGYHPNHGRAA